MSTVWGDDGMNKKQSSLLINEYPLMVLPHLATIIGLNEAIILQQLHFWLRTNPHERDGRKWSYNSYSSWQNQFPFWSISTIKRTIGKLEENGLIITGNYNKVKIDRTKWYAINYDVLEKLKEDNYLEDKNDTPNGADCTDQGGTLTKPIPETISETPTETTKDKDLPASPKETGSAESTLSSLIKFPDLTVSEKETKLKTQFGSIKHNEMVGLLGDLLIQNKPNAKEFLKATGGMKLIYPQIGQMLKKFPLDFLVDFFVGPKIPFRSDIPWKNYWWGACNKEYAYWSADREVARSKAREQEVPLIDFTDLIAEKSEGRWR